MAETEAHQISPLLEMPLLFEPPTFLERHVLLHDAVSGYQLTPCEQAWDLR